MTGRTPWAVLGLAEGASCQDVRRAFRRRAKESHPDRGGDGREFAAVVRAAHDLLRLVPLPGPEGPCPPSATPYDHWLRPPTATRTWSEGAATMPPAGAVLGAAGFAAVLRGEMARLATSAS
ncbi:MAG TPA: J domain-containing protein [Acidimicrobiales bacterium]|nr:J domain-containing protein [Acidimicrobiales bacterium]